MKLYYLSIKYQSKSRKTISCLLENHLTLIINLNSWSVRKYDPLIDLRPGFKWSKRKSWSERKCMLDLKRGLHKVWFKTVFYSLNESDKSGEVEWSKLRKLEVSGSIPYRAGSLKFLFTCVFLYVLKHSFSTYLSKQQTNILGNKINYGYITNRSIYTCSWEVCQFSRVTNIQ